MTPPTLDEKLARLEEETRFLSGGYQRNPLFQEIVALGDAAVPRLLQRLAEETNESFIASGLECTWSPWLLFQLLRTILGDRGPVIAEADRLDPILRLWLDWAREHGCV